MNNSIFCSLLAKRLTELVSKLKKNPPGPCVPGWPFNSGLCYVAIAGGVCFFFFFDNESSYIGVKREAERDVLYVNMVQCVEN